MPGSKWALGAVTVALVTAAGSNTAFAQDEKATSAEALGTGVMLMAQAETEAPRPIVPVEISVERRRSIFNNHRLTFNQFGDRGFLVDVAHF